MHHMDITPLPLPAPDFQIFNKGSKERQERERADFFQAVALPPRAGKAPQKVYLSQTFTTEL